MVKQLLRRPHPCPGESLAGYMMRLAESNYYRTPHWIFQMSGLKIRSIYANVFYPAEDDLFQLSQISDTDVDTLWSMAFTPAGQLKSRRYDVQVLGNVIPRVYLLRNRVKLCPICLQEAAYHRLIWDLTIVNTCPVHQCWLIDKCPKCHQFIEWNRPKIAKCRCRFDWRESSVTAPSLDLSTYVYQLCQIPGVTSLPNLGTNRFYSQLSLNQLLILLSALLKFCRLPYINYKFFWPIRKQKAYLFNSDSYWELAFSLFNDWPNQLVTLIASYQDSLVYYPDECLENRRHNLNVIKFFCEVFKCFSSDPCQLIRVELEECFWQFLSSQGVRKLQIRFRTRVGLYTRQLSIKPISSLEQKLASAGVLVELSLARLLAESQVELGEQTIFFKKIYAEF